MTIERSYSHYRIIKKLGEGGMSRVYLAEDTHLERKTALKVLAPEFAADPERLARFEREAKTVASINHPNIVTIYSVEQTDEVRFLTMELVEGRTLDRLIPDRGMSLSQFFSISLPLADALSAAHGRGVMHRDLKPKNIMVNNEGRVKVLDFGLAKLFETQPHVPCDVSDTLTADGRILGTIPYMSPEQLTGVGVDHRSDIFALGIVLHEMATGTCPFQGASSIERITSILRDDPYPITVRNKTFPSQLSLMISLCLEKKPSKRIQKASELHDQLRGIQRELVMTGVLSGDETGVAVDMGSAGDTATGGGRRESTLPPQQLGLLSSRLGLSLVMLLVFAANWLETSLEERAKAAWGVGQTLGHQLARAVHWLEGGVVFENHDATNMLAVYGSSVAYFFLFPALILGTAFALARRKAIRPLRVFTLSVAFAYALSLPFYLFFPVPERWSYPESGATLLSDLWSSRLIETFRPISGLDNCFPSFHVSLTVVLVLICYQFGVRMRTTVLALGLTVILATFVLGIHWIADVLAGGAVGITSVWLANRVDSSIASPLLEPRAHRLLALRRGAALGRSVSGSPLDPEREPVGRGRM